MNIQNLIRHPKNILIGLLKHMVILFPDKLYLELLYFLKIGKFPNLKNPKYVQEKYQWLKLNDRNPIYTNLVDKYAVKNFVSEKIGKKYVIPTIGIWDNPDEINWESLPNEFVLKTTNGGGGGGVIICRNKKKLDIKEAKQIISKSFNTNIFKKTKEWPYKNLRPKVLAESLITNIEKPWETLNDYKLYCFNGEIKFILVVQDRYGNQKSFDYFDKNWEHLPFCDIGEKNAEQPIPKPSNLQEMIRIAEILSKGIPHVRVDLFDVNDQILFGEMTFFDASGFAQYKPSEWNEIIGSYFPF